MNISKGSVVIAKAGRDKQGAFLVVDLDGKYAYICDGKRRRVETPKKKSLIHLQATAKRIDLDDNATVTNRQIKQLLNQFKSN